jgi:hypothetical protein
MKRTSNALAVLLAGKTPEAEYDALYAGRPLSARAEEWPPEVLALLKAVARNAHVRPLVRATLYERLAAALRDEGYLNAAGEALASRPVSEEQL